MSRGALISILAVAAVVGFLLGLGYWLHSQSKAEWQKVGVNGSAPVALKFRYDFEGKRYFSSLSCQGDRAVGEEHLSPIKAERACSLLVKSSLRYDDSLSSRPPKCSSGGEVFEVRVQGRLKDRKVDRSYYRGPCPERRQDMAEALGLIELSMPVEMILYTNPLDSQAAKPDRKPAPPGVKAPEVKVGPAGPCKPGQKSTNQRPCIEETE